MAPVARGPRMSRKMAVALLYLTCFDAFMTCKWACLYYTPMNCQSVMLVLTDLPFPSLSRTSQFTRDCC